MKRYRVWEANRKIFLFPENWLEPEFRTTKSHLCRTLEGALLQGDVTNDLAESAFLEYLVGLEELARLEIMSVWMQENLTDSSQNRLHVLGRTHHQPHKYFYRTYADLMWTPWEPVTTKIDGDHVVLTFWRERPYIFWLTFLDKPTADGTPDLEPGKTLTLPKSPKTTVEIQLHWSEHTGGRWSAGATSGHDNPLVVPIDRAFDRNTSLVYASVQKQDGHDIATIILRDGLSAPIGRSRSRAGTACRPSST